MKLFRHIASTLAVLMLFAAFLPSCASKSVLYQTEINGATAEVIRASGKSREVRVTDGDTLLWSDTVAVDASVKDLTGGALLRVADLNFDGKSDLLLTVSQTGECTGQVCFLSDASGTYARCAALDGLCNLSADAESGTFYSFEHTRKSGNVPGTYVSTDAATEYSWENGTPVPLVRVSLSYFSETDIYLYAVSSYDPAEGAFADSDDKYLTPEQYRKADFGFLYYFR